MKNLLKDLFISKNFNPNLILGSDFYSHKNQDEYYLLHFLERSDLEKTEKPWNKYIGLLIEKKGSVYKNTSLIILLKLDNLAEREEEKLKNQIFKIEEDEYFFRKYVICYTEKAVTELKKIESLDEKSLSKKLEENGKFDKFQNNNIEDEAYFLLIQLFVKLPFLVFHPTQDDDFKSLDLLILENTKIDFKLKNKILLEEVDFEELGKNLLSEEIEDDKIEFLQTFSPEKNEN